MLLDTTRPRAPARAGVTLVVATACLVAVRAASAAPPSAPPTVPLPGLYGMSGPGGGAGLYTLNRSTGGATLVANLSGSAVFASLGGLDFLGGTLYASGVYAGGATYSFGRLDPVTAAFTEIVQQDQANWQGLAGNEAAGLLYTVGADTAPFTLKSITPAGIITDIGPTGGVAGAGMAYDNVHGILYATAANNTSADLYTLSTATGAATLVGNMGTGNDSFGLAYDAAGNAGAGVLYLNDGTTNSLYSVNTSSGLATLIGPNGVAAAIDALAFIPEPTSLSAAAVCCVTTLVARRRRRPSPSLAAARADALAALAALADGGARALGARCDVPPPGHHPPAHRHA